jgi:hypothetical protein
MSNRRDIQFTYNPHNKATVLDCNFIVDSTNGNGDGIRSLDKGGRVASVYMHTSASPAAGNPNPAAGYIVVNLQDNYNKYLGGYSGFVSPPSGSAISSGLTVGQVYTIAALSSSTLAQWQTAGLQANITPAVDVSFVAAATSVAGGGTVFATASSGIDHIEVVGDANLMNSNGAIVTGAGNGMQLILACYADGVLTAPANNTVIGLNFYMNNSAQGV